MAVTEKGEKERGREEEGVREKEKRWAAGGVGGCDWLACERHKDNRKTSQCASVGASCSDSVHD